MGTEPTGTDRHRDPVHPVNAGPIQNPKSKIRSVLEAVRIQESLFALPFAYVGMLLAARGLPPIRPFLSEAPQEKEMYWRPRVAPAVEMDVAGQSFGEVNVVHYHERLTIVPSTNRADCKPEAFRIVIVLVHSSQVVVIGTVRAEGMAVCQ